LLMDCNHLCQHCQCICDALLVADRLFEPLPAPLFDARRG
jgi:hypothetical protein